MKKNLFFVATAFFLGGAMMSFDGGTQTAEQQVAKIVDSLSNDFLMKKDIECKTAAVSAAVAAYEASKTAPIDVPAEDTKGGKSKPSKTTKPTSTTGGASTGGTTGGASNSTPTPTPTNDKAGKMSGGNTTNTADKKDKMSGGNTNATQDKKDKMNKGGN